VISDLPARPRLAAHVLARRHLAGDEARVVLHDRATGRLVHLAPREWDLLAAADGTRDLGGILLAAGREDIHDLAALLEPLQREGMLEDGDDTPPAAPPRGAAPDPSAGDRRLDPLPGFTLACDGSGGCCGSYASILFRPVEAARARALLPQILGGGERHDRVFTPEHGSGSTSVSAVTLREGRCVYLTGAGRCGIHEAGGAAAKPAACSAYPMIYVDDGETVRASPTVECACVIASADCVDGAPIVPPGARVRRDLDPALAVHTLPWRVDITPEAMALREDFVAWSRRVAALPLPADTAAALFSLGAAVASGGLDADPARAFADPAPLAPAAVMPWVAALHRRAAERAREDSTWRSERDLALGAVRWIARAAASLLDPEALAALLAAPIPSPRAEALYLRALLHGHGLAGGPPLSRALQDRAVRLLLARAMPPVLAAAPAGELGPPSAHPLARVEAMLRGHGLDAYAYDVV
jgi:lysine-N-methylase